jgi:hypothetical protein
MNKLPIKIIQVSSSSMYPLLFKLEINMDIEHVFGVHHYYVR